MVVNRVVKTTAILLGAFGTMVSAMSAVGAVTEQGWARFGVAGALTLGIPGLVWRRFGSRAARAHDRLSLASETYALVLLGMAFVFIVALHAITSPLLAREADREYRAGAFGIARCVYALAGVTLVAEAPER